MSFSRTRSIYLWLVVLGLLSFLAVYAYMSIPPAGPEKSAQKVEASAVAVVRPEFRVMVEEKYLLCQKYALQCSYANVLTGAARDELNNLTPTELQEKFPETAGWSVRWENNRIVLEQSRPGLCPGHKKRWHLAADEKTETIQVYLGPAVTGTDSEMVKATEIKLNSLPPDIQNKIRSSSLEFLDWEDLVAALDSLAEFE